MWWRVGEWAVGWTGWAVKAGKEKEASGRDVVMRIMRVRGDWVGKCG